MSMGTLMYDEHPIYNLGYIEQADFREVLDQDWYGLYRRKGYKIPLKYKGKYKKLKRLRTKEIFEEFIKCFCVQTLFNDIVTLIKLVRIR